MKTQMLIAPLLALVCATTQAGSLGSTRIEGAGIASAGLQLYGCDTGVAQPGWTLRYVANGGGGLGTIASPFATLNTAIASVSASTRLQLCVASGVFQESIDLGTNRYFVIVGGFAANFAARAPLTAPTVLQTATPANNAISAQSPRSLTIDGLEITGSQRRGLLVTLWDSAPPNNETVVVRNCHIHHNGATTNPGGSALTGGVSIGGGRYPSVTVANNVIEENDGWHHGGGLNVGGNSGNAIVRDASNDGFGAISSQVAGLASVAYNIVRNNRIHETSLPHGAGIALGMNAVVDHNEIVGNDTVGAGDHFGVGGGLIAQHGTSNDSTNALVQVQNNWFEGNQAGRAGSALFLDQTHAGYVINNVIVGNLGPAAVLVDGACSNSCAGPGGDYDRNFITLVSNTLVGNAGAALAVQDSTAHLFFNVSWNNGAADDIQMANGSPGAATVVRGRDNVIDSANPGLSGTIDASALSGVVDAEYRLVAETVGAALASTTDPGFTSAFTFNGSLYVAQAYAQDFQGQGRPLPNGRWLYGAYAAVAGDDRIFASGFD